MHEIKVSVLQRPGQKSYYLQYRDPLTGRKVRKTAKATTRRGAERAAATWEKELREQGPRSGGRMKWCEFRDLYDSEALSSLADNTQKRADSVFNVLEVVCNPQRIGDVTAELLSRYQAELRTMGRAEATIKSHLAHIRAALSWANNQDLLPQMPKFPKIKRAKASKIMKGRPITTEEFERMLEAVEKVIRKPNLGRKRKPSPPDWDRIPSWEHLLTGLWTSGLRLGEALSLHWTDTTKIHVVFDYQHPMLRIPSDQEKGNKDRLLPIVPEFAKLLDETPESKRVGFVFNPKPQNGKERLGQQRVMNAIIDMGKKASVVVNQSPKKFASAHDLRRSFGERWAGRVMPQVLMELMRHETIETTMKFYVGRNALKTAAAVWNFCDGGDVLEFDAVE